jgi:hypothetical protein
MASKLEEKLAAAMGERERREIEMRHCLERIRDMNLPTSRRLLVHQCMSWLELNEQCNELVRAICDAADAELIAMPVETFRGKAVAV